MLDSLQARKLLQIKALQLSTTDELKSAMAPDGCDCKFQHSRRDQFQDYHNVPPAS